MTGIGIVLVISGILCWAISPALLPAAENGTLRCSMHIVTRVVYASSLAAAAFGVGVGLLTSSIIGFAKKNR
jgi:hypothetical protein